MTATGFFRTSTILLIDDQKSAQMTARSNRCWARLSARLRADSLDRQLADGRSPESGRVIAARAQLLVTPTMRRTLADGLANLLVNVYAAPGMRSPRVRVNREAIAASHAEVQELIDLLSNPRPIPARGTAMVSRLLRDGTGPLYNRRCSADLGPALAAAIAALDSSALLVPTA